MFPAQYIEGMNAPTTLRVLAACLLTAGTTSLPLSARLAAQDTTHIVVVSTTDVHGHASGWDFVEGRPFPGGLTRAATVIDSLRARYPGQVVLVDAGDLLAGDPFAAYWHEHARDPHPMLETMDELEYDAIVPGNHEFNYGWDFFHRVYTGRNFRPVCANCLLPGAGFGGRDSLLFAPFITVSRGGVRVAIAGLTTPGSMVWDGEKLRGHLKILPAGDRSVLWSTMRHAADLVVGIVHSGMDGAASYDTAGIGDENFAATLAAGSSRPDLVVVGHSHREMRDSVINGVHFVQPRNYAQSVSVAHVTLRRAGAGWQVAAIHADLVPLATVAESPRLARRLDPQVAVVKQWATELIGYTTGPFPAGAARAGATPLTTWMGEVMRATAHADLASTPAFSTRKGLSDGDVRRADVYGIYPYENTLRAVKITGAQLRAYLEQSARYYVVGPDGKVGTDPQIPGYNFDIVVGADYDFDLTRPLGQRLTRLMVRGRAVAPTDSLTLAVNNYRQAGGGGFPMIAHAPVVYDKQENVRDLLEAAVVRDTLRPERYGRESWRLLPLAAEDQARIMGGAQPRPRAATPKDTVILRILATNDIHGQIDPRVWPWSNNRPVGGLANLKTVMDSVANGCGGCPVIKIDAGDEFQGTLGSNLTYGRPVVEALNRIGIQAAATGNHDYDWGTDTLRRRMSEATYPWLASNLVDSATGNRPSWVKGWTMLQAGSRKVAVVGYAHPHTPEMTFKAAVAGLRFVAGPAPVKAAIAEARAAGADLVVLLAHFGGDCQGGCHGELFALVDSLGPGAVDAVIGGHSHWQVMGTSSTGVPVLQAGSSGRGIARIDLVKTVVGAREARMAVDTIWADVVHPDKGVDSVLARYRPRADSLSHTRVAVLQVPLERKGNEYALGHLIADADRNALRTDFAITNNGGIRRDLPAGPLDYGMAYEVMPFGNRLVKVTLPGRAMKELMEAILAGGRVEAHISGMTVKWDSTGQAGHRVKEIRLPDGHKIDDGHQYTLAVNDFMAQGAEQYSSLTRYPQDPIGVLDLDAFIGYLRRLPQPVVAPAEPRFVTR